MKQCFRICSSPGCWQCLVSCRPLPRLQWFRELLKLVAFHLFREPLLLLEMLLFQYRARASLMEPVHLRPLVLQRCRSPLLYIINPFNMPGMNRHTTITSQCNMGSITHLHMSWNINIIIVIIQVLCVTTDNIQQGYIDLLL